MKKRQIIFGILGILVGFSLLIFTMDNLGKPDNVPIAFNPIDGLEAYFFGFVYGLGTLGWILASLLLIGYLALCSFISVWISKKLSQG